MTNFRPIRRSSLAPPLVSASKRNGGVPDGIMQLDGALASLVDYSARTAFSPQEFLGLGAAICAVGALAGRKYASKGLRTNAFIVGLGDSGSGKDAARKCIRRAFNAAGVDTNYLGGRKIASDQAIFGAIENFPAKLFLLNEFGKLVGSLKGRNVSGHQANILNTLTELFTSASEIFRGTEYAKQTGQDGHPALIYHQPHLCIFGDTVGDVLWKATEEGALSDGSLARFLLFQSPDNNPMPNLAADDVDIVPAGLPEALQAIAAGAEGHDYGNLPMRFDAHLAPYEVPRDQHAAARLDELAMEQWRWKDRIDKENKPGKAFVARLLEHTVTLALIRAISFDPGRPVIRECDAEWAETLVRHCLRTVMRETENNVSDSAPEALFKRLLNVVRGAGQIDQTTLAQRSRFIPGGANQRNSMIAELVKVGDLQTWKIEADGDCEKPKTLYAIAAGRE
jgi:hypothetical protein